MAPVKCLAVLALASAVLASPFTVTSELAQLERRNACAGQSCLIAAASGSSGLPYDSDELPQFTVTNGECCVAAYNPAIKDKLYAIKPSLEEQCKNVTIPSGKPSEQPEIEARGEARCRPRTLIFAYGTGDTARFGGVLGQPLRALLQEADPELWRVKGVNYSADINGVFCLGLPGGVVAKRLLQKVARRCPDTEFVVAGYSQGAMVAREAVANSTVADRVKGIVTFGDPFQGAPVKGYTGPIRTYCNTGDLVCEGTPLISAAHSTYGGANVTDAAEWIRALF